MLLSLLELLLLEELLLEEELVCLEELRAAASTWACFKCRQCGSDSGSGSSGSGSSIAGSGGSEATVRHVVLA